MAPLSSLGQNPRAESANVDQMIRAAATQSQADAEPSSIETDEILPPMEGDDEYGELIIIERQSNWQPWNLNVYSGFLHTDNAALASDGFEVEDTYLRSGLSANYFPTIVGGLFGQIGFRQDFYHYDRFSELNFDYLRTNAGLFYSLPRHGTRNWLDWLLEDTSFFLYYNYYRVTENDLASELFTNHSISVGVQKSTPVARGHSIFYGISAEPSLKGDPTLSRRDEYRWFFGYSVEWTPKLRSLLTYTGGNFEYRESDRNDVDHYGSLINRLTLMQGYRGNTSWDCYLQLDANYDLNDSNFAFRDYENFNWGASLGLQLFF